MFGHRGAERSDLDKGSRKKVPEMFRIKRHPGSISPTSCHGKSNVTSLLADLLSGLLSVVRSSSPSTSMVMFMRQSFILGYPDVSMTNPVVVYRV